MSLTPIFTGRVLKGALLVLDRPRDYGRHVRSLAGEYVELVLRKQRTQRSYDQLRYWFGVPMALLSDHTGYTKMQMHYLCLAICFGVVADAQTGREIPVVPASRHLTVAQFSTLIEWCPSWAMETYQVSVPLPNEVDVSSLPGVEAA